MGRLCYVPFATTDADIDNHIRRISSTIFHPVGTTATSYSSSKSGVVDQNLLMKVADGLQTVGASVFVSDVELKIGKQIYSFR